MGFRIFKVGPHLEGRMGTKREKSLFLFLKHYDLSGIS